VKAKKAKMTMAQFLKELAKTKNKLWKNVHSLWVAGEIRCKKGLCPIEAVAYHTGGAQGRKALRDDGLDGAIAFLNLGHSTSDRIISAADGKESPTRKAILKAVGLDVK
jgi:hypothetical protein